MLGEQDQRKLPNDAAIVVVEVMKFVHHDRADILKLGIVAEQIIQKNFRDHNADRGFGVDAAVARNQPDALSPEPPVLNLVLKLTKLLVGQRDQGRGVIEWPAGI